MKTWVNYPIAALREAIVNAVYHRSYEYCIEPVKVYIYPERIEIISYPGPVPGNFSGTYKNQGIPFLRYQPETAGLENF